MAGEKQPSLKVAAAVAETAKKVGGAYVFSSTSKSILREENASEIIAGNKFAEFACADCGTEFAALEATSPFCIVCGSLHVKKGKEKAQSIHKDSELVSITCGACNSLSIVHNEISSAAKGGLHCASCGTELMSLTVKAADEVPTDDEVDVDDLDVLDVDDNADDVEATGEEEEKEEKEESEDTHEERPSMDMSADEEDKKEEEKEESEDTHEERPETDMDTAADEGDEERDDDGKEESEDKEEKKEDESNADEMPMNDYAEDVDMVDMVDEDNIDEMAIVNMSGAIHIAAGPHLVARLTQEKAGDNKDIFNTKQFQSAIIASLKDHGLAKTIETFGFEPIKVKANVKKHVAKLVKAGVEKEAADLKTLRETNAKAWNQALDIAAVGLNKSFWKGVQNPLKAALVRELSMVGVKGAEKIVAAIFEKNGLEYSAVLIKQAQELLAKSQEMRNELAEVLNMTGVLASDDDDEDDGDAGEEEESTPAVPVSEEKATKLKDEKRRGSEVSSASTIRRLGSLFE